MKLLFKNILCIMNPKNKTLMLKQKFRLESTEKYFFYSYFNNNFDHSKLILLRYQKLDQCLELWINMSQR